METIRVLVVYYDLFGKYLEKVIGHGPGKPYIGGISFTNVENLGKALEIIENFDVVICGFDFPFSLENADVLVGQEGELEFFLDRPCLILNFIKWFQIPCILYGGFPQEFVLKKLETMGVSHVKYLQIPLSGRQWLDAIMDVYKNPLVS